MCLPCTRAVRVSKLMLAVITHLDVHPDKFESALDVFREKLVYAEVASMIALCFETAAQLNHECSNEALCLLLGLSSADIDEIDNDPRNVYSSQGKCYTALLKWKSKNIDLDNPSKSTATYARLVEIAKEDKDREAIREIHKACVKYVSNESQPSLVLVTPAPKTTVGKYAEYLRDVYLRSKLPVKGKWPPAPCKKIIKLATIEIEEDHSHQAK
ncbi:uncharacterized protein LOC135347643 [Halichondria panicea]|uniref:uncharacterized protein LOC135347643 n=1 Tax=Halichondria panicea TaxID=6063 RepID=UPI00312BC6BD